MKARGKGIPLALQFLVKGWACQVGQPAHQHEFERRNNPEANNPIDNQIRRNRNNKEGKELNNGKEEIEREGERRIAVLPWQ